MKALGILSALAFVEATLAHGGHSESGPAKGETIQEYAQRHMASEHHIDAFDLPSFFQLHDLNLDGIWDREEIEAIYGVHHVYSQKKSADEAAHQEKADHIVNTVLGILDKNKDGKVTLQEFEATGLTGLPNFDDLGAEGHHYDVESEFFLHHEEQFHNTPETQTDESYNHPEDLEHFAHHEEIERKEAEKEAEYQGITVEEALAQHEEGAEAEQPSPATPSGPKVTRVTPPEMLDPAERFKDAKDENAEDWGAGKSGYKPPTTPKDKLRKNVPYKGKMQYKFKKNWGDF